jgi:hypothetical protein
MFICVDQAFTTGFRSALRCRRLGLPGESRRQATWLEKANAVVSELFKTIKELLASNAAVLRRVLRGVCPRGYLTVFKAGIVYCRRYKHHEPFANGLVMSRDILAAGP